jgi:SAM-dependent methyltransferase
MNTPHTPAQEQAAIWNGTAGQAWVRLQEVLDQMFKPLEDLLVEAIPAQARSVLDVGCGTGATTLAAARHIGMTGRCVGIDLSAPMIAAARVRAQAEGSPARFLNGDAQQHPFEADSVDHLVSRFGVMFFGDAEAAFTNLRRAARGQATLHFMAWRGAEENPFMTTAERAAGSLLNLPARQPDEPGQFAFARESRVRDLLQASGWTGIDLTPLDVDCCFPESGLVPYLTQLGPLGRVLPTVDEATRERIVAKVRAAFEAHVQGDKVRFRAACWQIRAKAVAS